LPPPLHIRRARLEDSEAISAVLRRAFRKYEPLYTLRGFAATTPAADEVAARLREGPIWIATDDDRPVGTAGAVCQAGQCYIRGVAVLPESRGRGVASALMATVENFARQNQARRLFLTTTPFLEEAIRLYVHLGFERIPEGPQDLYGTPLFAMAKDLDAENPSSP
jgi:ribosomal protein S18 acetylase RimI-like enzyme